MDVSKNILIAGAGKIGSTVATILGSQKNTRITLVDKKTGGIPKTISENPYIEVLECDVQNATALFEIIKEKSINAILSSLPYFCNFTVAEVAKANHCHYFDLTEDVTTLISLKTSPPHAISLTLPKMPARPLYLNAVCPLAL